MILVVYSGRKEKNKQNNNNNNKTTIHTASVIRHMRAVRIRVTKRVNKVGYLGVPVMLKLRHNLR